MPAANLSIIVKMSGGMLPPNTRAGDLEIYDNGKLLIFESDTDIVERMVPREKLLNILQVARQSGFFQLDNIIHDSGNTPNVPDVTISVNDSMSTGTVTITGYQKLKGEMRKNAFDVVYKMITDMAWESYNQVPVADTTSQGQQVAPLQQQNTSNQSSQASAPTLPSMPPLQQKPGGSFDLPSLDDLLKSSGLDFSAPLDQQSQSGNLPSLQQQQRSGQNQQSNQPSLPPLPKANDNQSNQQRSTLPPLNNAPQRQAQTSATPPISNQQQPNPQIIQKQQLPNIPVVPSVNNLMKPNPAPIQPAKPAQIPQAPVLQQPPVVPTTRPPTPTPIPQPLEQNIQMAPILTKKIEHKSDQNARQQNSGPNTNQSAQQSSQQAPQQQQQSIQQNPQVQPVELSTKNTVSDNKTDEAIETKRPQQAIVKKEEQSKEFYRKPSIGWEHTQELVARLEETLKSKFIVFYADDSHDVTVDDMRYLYAHLRKIGNKKSLTLLPVIKNGQLPIVWRMATLLREFCQELIIVMPEASSVYTTMLSLAADKILMNPLGYLTPIETKFKHPLLDSGLGQNASIPLTEVLQASNSFLIATDKPTKTKSDNTIDQSSTINPLVVTAAQRQFALTQMLCTNLLNLGKKSTKNDIDTTKVVDQLTRGYPSEDYPITFSEVKTMGLNIAETTEEMNDLLWELLHNYDYLTQPVMTIRDSFKSEEQQSVIIESDGRRTLYYKELHQDLKNNRVVDQYDRWREVTKQISIDQSGKEHSGLVWKDLQMTGHRDE